MALELEMEAASGDEHGGRVATTVLVIGEGAALFAAFCPSWFTVRSPFFHEQQARKGNIDSIRQGEVAATVITVAVGWAAASMVGSPYPMFGAVGVSVVMIAGYEYSIRHPATEKADAATHPLGRALAWRQAA